MTPQDFDTLVAEAFELVPEKFRERVKNVALLVEEEPSAETLAENKVPKGRTLLGLYHGIPATERGGSYGVGATMPDTITLYRKPIIAASSLGVNYDSFFGPPTEPFRDAIRGTIRNTLWHEIGHHFGMTENEVEEREEEGTNEYKA